MTIVKVSVDSAIELSPTGLFDALCSWRVRRRIVGPLETALGVLISTVPYSRLVEGRKRAHVFIEFEDKARIVEPAMFPEGAEWCQLGAIAEERRAFQSLRTQQQIDLVCERIKISLDTYLIKARRTPVRKKLRGKGSESRGKSN